MQDEDTRRFFTRESTVSNSRKSEAPRPPRPWKVDAVTQLQGGQKSTERRRSCFFWRDDAGERYARARKRIRAQVLVFAWERKSVYIHPYQRVRWLHLYTTYASCAAMLMRVYIERAGRNVDRAYEEEGEGDRNIYIYILYEDREEKRTTEGERNRDR